MTKQFLHEGTYFLIIVENGKVTHRTANVSLPHVEFVKRSIGALPDKAWVGSVTKVDGLVEAVNSFTFYQNQLPASEKIQKVVREAFE